MSGFDGCGCRDDFNDDYLLLYSSTYKIPNNQMGREGLIWQQLDECEWDWERRRANVYLQLRSVKA